MSDDLRFASPDVLSFQWPATERRAKRAHVAPTPRSPISRRQRDDLARLRLAQSLARRWEAGDDEVTVHDIIAILLP